MDKIWHIILYLLIGLCFSPVWLIAYGFLRVVLKEKAREQEKRFLPPFEIDPDQSVEENSHRFANHLREHAPDLSFSDWSGLFKEFESSYRDALALQMRADLEEITPDHFKDER